MDDMKLLFTGGHHTPAVSVIQKIREQDPNTKIFWIGHKYSMVNDTSVSAEYNEITELGIDFYELHAAKMYKNVSVASIFKFILSIFSAYKLLKQIKPDLVVSFGGYLAVPVVISAKILGIKSISHEQTRTSGFANRVIAYFTDEILLTWPTSAKFYERFKQKTSIVGLPVRVSVFQGERLQNLNNSLSTIYITGGKQGSHAINLVIEESIDKLLQNFNVIHQVGSNSFYKDYERIKELGKTGNGTYIIKKFVGQSEIGSVFKSTDLVITRGGANTIYELGLLGKPAIIIPITNSSHNEQYENARFLEECNSAVIVNEEELTSSTLINSVESINKKLDVYTSNANKINSKLIKNANVQIAEKISNWLSKAG